MAAALEASGILDEETLLEGDAAFIGDRVERPSRRKSVPAFVDPRRASPSMSPVPRSRHGSAVTICVNVPVLSQYANVDAVQQQDAPGVWFPKDEALQNLERKDREWLQYRQTARRLQEQEDLMAYQTRLEARQHQYLYHTAGDGLDDSAGLIDDADRAGRSVLVCVDEKKGEGHGAQLADCVRQVLHPGNALHLLNCHRKGRQPDAGHMAAIAREVQGDAALSEVEVTRTWEEVGGSKGECIINYVAQRGVDLIVLGMKEEKQAFFETKVSTDVINACPQGRAVLMIPPGMTFPRQGRRVLMSYDGTPNSREALTAMAHILRPQDSVVLFQVVTPPPKLVVVMKASDMATLQPNADYKEVLATRVREAETALAHVKALLTASLSPKYIPAANITTEHGVLKADKKTSVVDFIAEAANQHESELLVMSVRAVPGWQALSQAKYKRSLLIVK